MFIIVEGTNSVECRWCVSLYSWNSFCIAYSKKRSATRIRTRAPFPSIFLYQGICDSFDFAICLSHFSQEYGRFDDSFAAVQDLSIQNHQRVKQPETLQKTGLKHEESNRRFKLLKAFLALFSEFKNPKALFQESKLYDIYMEMLMHHDNEIQQMVCNCLKTYKFDYLKPYEEYINKLFQDDTIRDSLTMFSASDDSQLVQTEHRHGIMNIITRYAAVKR